MDRRKFLNFTMLAGMGAGLGLVNAQNITPNTGKEMDKVNIPWDRGTRLVLLGHPGRTYIK